MVKTTGIEFKRFYNNEVYWPQTTWHDDLCLVVDGQPLGDDADPASIPDTASVVIESGIVFSVPASVFSATKQDGYDLTFEDYFLLWKKKQTTVSMVVECDRNTVDKIIAAVTEAGGTIIR